VTTISFDLGGAVGIAIDTAAGLELITLDYRNFTIGAMATRFEGRLRELIYVHAPDLIAYEEPIGMFSKPGKGAAVHAHRVYGQAVLIQKLAYNAEIDTAAYNVSRVRKKFAGSGRATPDAILKAAYKIGAEPADEHQADAVLIHRASLTNLQISLL